MTRSIFSLILDTAKYYNISLDKAKQNIKNIYNVIQSNWKLLAKSEGISEYEINMMKNAFDDKSVYQSLSFMNNSEKNIKIKSKSGRSDPDDDFGQGR